MSTLLDTGRPSVDDLKSRVDDLLAHVQRETGVPSIAAALSIDGKRVFSGVGVGEGSAGAAVIEDARFPLGCLKKLVTSMVALELAAEGRLDLSAPIGEYLPELKDTIHGGSVNLRHLLSHTSGYKGINVHEADAARLDWGRFVEYLRGAPQYFAPGTVYNYEHTEAAIVGEIIRRVAGGESAALESAVLPSPLGLGTVSAAQDAEPFWAASFSWRSISLANLLAIAELLMGNERVPEYGGRRPLSPSALALLRERVVNIPAVVGVSSVIRCR